MINEKNIMINEKNKIIKKQ